MKEPGLVPARSDWPVFRNPELGLNRRIVHKLADGCVDLEIRSSADRMEEIEARNRHLLTDGFELAQTTKSASIRVRVKVVDRFGDMQIQIDAVREGLSAASRLLALSAQIDGASLYGQTVQIPND